MTSQSKKPILITGVGRRLGFALSKHFLAQGQPVIGTYRTDRPEINELKQLGAFLCQCDFYNEEQTQDFLKTIHRNFDGLSMLVHNASDWLAEKDGEVEADIKLFDRMMRIHASLPYQLNISLAPLLVKNPDAHSDIIHITDYVIEKGSHKHIAYAASKAAMSNMTLSFAGKYAPKIKVNSIAPALMLFNEGDDAAYKKKTLEKSLMGREGGVSEFIAAVEYLQRSHFITGRTLTLDGGRHLK